MRGPHKREYGGDFNKCALCGRDLQEAGWELCKEAPEFPCLPKPGQIWEIHNQPLGVQVVVITHVDNLGGYNTPGGCPAGHNVYSTHTGEVAPDFPPYNWRLLKDAEINPWDNVPGCPNRVELLMEGKDRTSTVEEAS